MDLSVVILTLMKLPDAKMASLKRDFGASGLCLEDFVAAIIRHMPQPSQKEDVADRIETASDLTDFFAQVDVDGKGVIKWEDFLGYIIEQSVALKRDIQFQDCYKVRDDYDLAATNHREFIGQIFWNPVHNRLFCSVGQKIKVLHLFSKEPSKARLCCEISLSARGSLDYVGAHDIVYIEEHDLLLCLQINLCVSFYKFSRQFLSAEYIVPAGDVTLSHQPYKVRWSRATQQVITVGNGKNIMAWALKKTGEATYTLVHKHTLTGHTDVIQAIIFVTDMEGTELLVSAGLDRRIMFWDLTTYRCVKVLSGHHGSINCLAYDGDSQVFSGGYDNEIYVWDVKGSISSPTYKLEGPHKTPLQSMSCCADSGRLCTLDRQGKAVLWDVRKNVAFDPRDRFIQVLPGWEKERASSVEMVAPPASLSKKFTLNGISIVLAGNRISLYDCIDRRPPDAHPSMVVYNAESVTILTVHGSTVKVWDACSGQFMKEFMQLSRSDITSVTLDRGKRKLIVSNVDGDIEFFNYFNGKLLRQIPHRSVGEVSSLVYAERSQLLITASSDRSLRVVDELASSDNDCLLRLVKHAHNRDICLLTYDEDLCLLATVSEDGLIKIWDCEFMLLDGSYMSSTDITTLAFMYPWPVLLAGDSAGGVTLIPVRPWASHTLPVNTAAFRVRCMGGTAAVNSQEAEGGVEEEGGIRYALRAITCLSVATMTPSSDSGLGKRSYLVYIGNAKGVVRVYDLEDLLANLGIGICAEAELTSRKPKYNSRRKLVRKSQGEANKDISASTAPQQEPEPPLRPPSSASQPSPPPPPPQGSASPPPSSAEDASPDMDDASCTPKETMGARLVYSWVAHEEAVVNMNVLDHPEVLFTSSQDMSVKLWSRFGALLGVLTWGRQADLSQRRVWHFPFDFSERHCVRTERARRILTKLKQGSHAKTVRQLVEGGGDAGVNKHTNSTATMLLLPNVASKTIRATTRFGGPTLRGGSSRGSVPSSADSGLPPTAAVPALPLDEHDQEVQRILAQLRGEATWKKLEWEVAREKREAAKRQQDRSTLGADGKAKRRLRRRRRQEGGGAGGQAAAAASKRDPILRTINSVDKVVAKFTTIQRQQEQLQAPRQLSSKDSGAPVVKASYEGLKASYEGRQHDMYPNLFLAQEKAEAQSEFSKAVRRLEHLKDLLKDAASGGGGSIASSRAATPAADGLRTPEGYVGVMEQGEFSGKPRETADSLGMAPPSDPLCRPSDTAEPCPSLTDRITVKTVEDTGKLQRSRRARLSASGRAGSTCSNVSLQALTIPEEAPAEEEAEVQVPITATDHNNLEKKVDNEGNIIKRLTRATQASVHMESPAKPHHHHQPRVNQLSNREREEKRVKVKRRFGPYSRADLLDMYACFRALDSRHHRGQVALKDLLATRFIEANPDFRTQLESHYYGKEGSRTRMVNLRQAIRMVFPLVGKVERRQVMVLIDMYENHLAQATPSQATNALNQTIKMATLKSLFEMYDRDGSGTVEISEVVEGLRQGRTGMQWRGIEKELATIANAFSGKGGMLSFEDFARAFQDII